MLPDDESRGGFIIRTMAEARHRARSRPATSNTTKLWADAEHARQVHPRHAGIRTDAGRACCATFRAKTPPRAGRFGRAQGVMLDFARATPRR